MPIPVQQFQVAPSGVAAGLSQMLQGGMAGYQQAQKMKQQKMQQEQAQQMAPLQQQLLMAQIGKAQAEGGAIPMKIKSEHVKQLMDHDAKLLQVAKESPDSMQNKDFARAVVTARKRMSQGEAGYGQQEQQAVDVGAPKSEVNADDIRQAQESARSREIKATVNPQIQQQRVRARSSDVMLKNIKKDLAEVMPNIGGAKNIEQAIASYAQSTGLDIGESKRKLNSLFNKKIKIFSEELSAGLGTPAAEKAHERIASFADPSSDSYGNVQQLMENLNALEEMHRINYESLFQSSAQQEAEANQEFGGNVPRGTQPAQQGQSISYGGKSYTRADLERIAAGGK